MSEIKVFINFHRVFLKNFLNPLSIVDYLPCLPVEVKDEIYKATDSPSRQVEILLAELENSSDAGALRTFLDSLKSSPEHDWLYPLFEENAQEENVLRIFKNLENIDKLEKLCNLLRPQMQNIDVHHCVDALSHLFAPHEKENLKQKCQNYGNRYAIWWLFRILIRKEKGWIEDFHDFVKEQNYASSTTCGRLAKVILDFFDFEPVGVVFPQNDFGQNVDGHSEKYFVSPSGDLSMDGREENFKRSEIILNVGQDEDAIESSCSFQTADCNLFNALKEEAMINNFSAHADEAQRGSSLSRPAEEPSSNALAGSLPPLRNYQKELVELAVNGENVIICSPPGSGKTIVAAFIIKDYLETRGNSQKSTLFFTPGAALAQQQAERLNEYMPNEFQVELCHGNSEESSLELHMHADIIILTPQILLNALLNKTEENPIRSIDQFGLLIFDECHHCMKNHAYNGVMREYFNSKRSSGADDLPQVVGLTATMGVGKTPQDADTEILQLCANLDARSGIVTVRKPENIEELYSRIPQPKEETFGLPKRQNNQFYKKLMLIMDEVMNILEEFEAFSKLVRPPPYHDLNDNLEQFVQWSRNVKTDISRSVSTGARDMNSCVQYLELCSHAKDMFLKIRPADALKELERYVDLKQPDKFTAVETKLYAIFQSAIPEFERLAKDKNCANPSLQKIEKLILDKFEREPNSSGMLMVQKQIYTKALKEWMNDEESLKFLNAEIFTGTTGGTNPNATGMSHELQKTIMRKFREGKHKMLISTPDAAGEGIDVANCNLIIEYDFLKNEIATKQIKGRVRKREGEVLRISSAPVAIRDELNLQKTLLMNRAIKSIQRIMEDDSLQYLKQLALLQEKSRLAHQAAMRAKLAMRPRDTGKEYFLECRKCKTEVCSSLDVRVVEGCQHTIPTAEFEKKRKLMEHPRRDNMGPSWQKLNKVLCLDCSNDWGIEAIWEQQLTLPLIKIEGFRVKDAAGRIYLPKKWKNSPFEPIKSSLLDLINAMVREPDSNQSEGESK